MNLPATAIEFLDAFRGVLTPIKAEDSQAFDKIYGDAMPMVHCHTFTKELEAPGAERDLRQVGLYGAWCDRNAANSTIPREPRDILARHYRTMRSSISSVEWRLTRTCTVSASGCLKK